MVPYSHGRAAIRFVIVTICSATAYVAMCGAAEPCAPPAVVDLSLTVAAELPCVWPVGMTPLAVVPTAGFGRTGRHRDMLVIDEHTGTQWDAPAHFVPPPDSGLDGAGPMGVVTGDKVPAWQFCGEACVIDLTKHRDEAAPGESFLIGPEHVREWEIAHRPLGPGDVVCFRTGYTDAYYKPFPVGERYVKQCNGVDFATYVDWLLIVAPATLAACPALSLPCGFTKDGLPVGLQMIGASNGDARLLSAAGVLEDVLGLQTVRPVDPRS